MAKLNLKKENEMKMIENQLVMPLSDYENRNADLPLKLNETKINNSATKGIVSSTQKKPISNSSSNISSNLKYGESEMRIRQVMRVAKNIIKEIEILERISKKNLSNRFITPLELRTKKKRWEDFMSTARKTIYSLEREVR